MAVTLEATATKAACDAIVDLLDGGTGDPSGDLSWETAADVVLANTTLQAPAFGAATSAAPSVATLLGTTLTSAAASGAGTCTKAKFRDKANIVQFTCSVGTSGADINLSNNVIVVGEFIALTAFTFTMPASS